MYRASFTAYYPGGYPEHYAGASKHAGVLTTYKISFVYLYTCKITTATE
jgi:hypothetical protein